MHIRSVGPVDDVVTLMGTEKSCVYLVRGEEYALIGGAGQWVVPELESQLREWGVDVAKIRYLVLGHAHFDHCGAVPYLLARYPHIQVVGSAGAAEFLAIAKAQRNTQRFSREATLRMECPMEFEGHSLEWQAFPVGRVVGDGDCLDLGAGVELHFLTAPGHSRCGLFTYLPANRCLFPSDALHVPEAAGSGYLCTASESFVDYAASLRKLTHLPVEICAWEHHGLHTGDDARDCVARGMELTRHFQHQMRAALEQGGSAEELAEKLGREWLERSGFVFVTAEILCHIYRVMLDNALREPSL